MVENCNDCKYKELGINFTNCKRKCTYKYQMQRLRTNKDVQNMVSLIYRKTDNYLRNWVKDNYNDSESIKKNQETAEALLELVDEIQRELIKYSPQMDFLNNDLIGSKE